MATLPGAEGAVLEATKDVMRASMVEQGAEEAAASQDDKKSKNLQAKALKIRGDIVREAISREAAMHDKDEAVALSAALKALKEGDAERAEATLRERLAGVRGRRRRALRGGAGSDSDSDSDSDSGGGADAAAPAAKQPAALAVRSAAEWEALVGGGLGAACAADAGQLPPPPAERTADLLAQLGRGAYLMGAPPPGAPGLCARLLGGLHRLRAAEIEPFFIWMFDEAWTLLLSFWSEAEALLGDTCVLEPTFAAYHLNPQMAQQKNNQYVGTNFGLPHRDYTFTDSHAADGTPKILTMWVPLTMVSTENGCMYVVPKEFDENYERDSVYEHMVVSTTGWMAGKSHLSFPVAGVRPLAPVTPGSLCAWYGNVIHWGAHCHASAAETPRASLAWVFRLASSATDPEVPPLSRQEVRTWLV